MRLTPSEIEDARRFVAPVDRLVADLIETIAATEAEVRARLAEEVKALPTWDLAVPAGRYLDRAAVIALIQPEGAKAACVSCAEPSHDEDTHDHHYHGDRGDPYVAGPCQPEGAKA